MLAPKELPTEFFEWNRKHKAPFGANWWVSLLQSKHVGMYAGKYGPGWLAWKYRTRLPSWVLRNIGPFGFQLNSATRVYEYPWAFLATPLVGGNIKAVEIGAGASGFQFALAAAGVQVTSVDPLINPSESIDWRFSMADFNRLNRAFGGGVRFVNGFLEAANLEADSHDRVYALSVIEHIPLEQRERLMKEIARILKPGGYFVATIDLFLDCAPFTSKEQNEYGTNVSVKALLEAANLQLAFGNSSELCGFKEFSPATVKSRVAHYLVASKVMTQCVVMQKQQ